MAKPDDLFEWASNEQDAELEDPSPQMQQRGYRTGEPADPGIFNRLLNNVFDWVTYLRDWAEGHDHRDDGSDGSMPKIGLNDEVDFGTYGRFEVKEDEVNIHNIQHEHTETSSLAWLTSGRLEATEEVLSPVLDAGSGNFIDVQNGMDVPLIRPSAETPENDHYLHFGLDSFPKAIGRLSLVHDTSESENWRIEWRYNNGGWDESLTTVNGQVLNVHAKDAEGLGSGDWDIVTVTGNIGTSSTSVVSNRGWTIASGDADFVQVTPIIWDEIVADDWTTLLDNDVSGLIIDIDLVAFGMPN